MIVPLKFYSEHIVGIERFTRRERFALVTDVEWLKQRCRVFSFLLPARLRILPSTEAQITRAWIRRPLGPAIQIGGPNE